MAKGIATKLNEAFRRSAAYHAGFKAAMSMAPEVTPEMIRAGEERLADAWEIGPARTVESVYRAMESVRQRTFAHRPPLPKDDA